MMGKILLPLLLAVAAVAGDDTADLCNQLTTQFNSLQSLVPLEVDVKFPTAGPFSYISGYAKFRMVSGLTVPDGGCSSSVFDDKLSKRLSIKLASPKAFIISQTKVLLLTNVVYTLTLDVQESKSGSGKTVTVNEFSYTYDNLYDDTMQASIVFRNFVNQHLQISLKNEIERKLTATFDLEKRIEINPNLVKELMLNVYLATAQDF